MTIHLRGVRCRGKTLASGQVRRYWYHRATGKRLPDDPGNLALLEEVRLDRCPGTPAVADRTFSHLVREYIRASRSSSGWMSSLAPGIGGRTTGWRHDDKKSFLDDGRTDGAAGLEGGEEEVVMIDAIDLSAHRTASRLRAIKGADDRRGRLIGCTKGGLNTRLHAVTDTGGRPLKVFRTAGPVSDHSGAAALPDSLPAAGWRIADPGHDADRFREALKHKGIRPCIPGRETRGKPVRHDKRRCKGRSRIGIMFGRLKDWRRIATRHDRCARTVLSARVLAATVMFRL